MTRRRLMIGLMSLSLTTFSWCSADKNDDGVVDQAEITKFCTENPGSCTGGTPPEPPPAGDDICFTCEP